MKDRIDDALGRWLVAWVGWVERKHRLTIGLITAATLVLGLFTVTRLGVNMDHKQLLDRDLPFQKAATRFSQYFPDLEDSLLIVIDGKTPELARSAADAIADRLRQKPDRFTDVYVPRGGRFLEEHALLYRSVDELDDFTDHLAQIQPVLGELTRDASIANMARLIRLALEQEVTRGANAADWAAVLDRVGDATVRVFDEYPVSISWEGLILEGSPFDPGTRQVVVAEPVLDFGSLLPAGEAIGEIRAIARDLSFAPERGVQVRITGNPALNQEEMIGLAWDVGVSSLFSFAFVTGVLFVAFRSLRLVSAAALTLLAGLIWTAAFAAAAVGHLNVLSIAFGVLFIGLGVDFAIHMGMSYADFVAGGKSSAAALREAAGQVGAALVLCMITTVIGFLSFVPTDYKGVAELGLISGAGMVVILFQTMTLFPAIVTARIGEGALKRVRSALQLHLSPPAIVGRHPGTVVIISVSLGIVAATLVPRLRFDANVVNMRDDRTESVQTFRDLLSSSETSPWYVDVLTPSLAEAQERARRLRELEVVEATLTLADFVPQNQEEKIEVLADAALLLDTPAGPAVKPAQVSTEDQIAALEALHEQLDGDWLAEAKAPLSGSARRLRDELKRFLDRIEAHDDPAAALQDLEKILLGNFSSQLTRLRRALEPSPIRLETLPDEITSRMVATDGHARIQVFPSDDLNNTGTLRRYVDPVRSLEPDATGVAVNILEFGRATTRSLREALLSAAVAITFLVFFLWRRWVDTALVMSPVLLAAALTAGTMVLLGIRFDFTNVVVLPLLLGIGVDSGIHLVHRAGQAATDDLLETTTARAVFFSALTTVASFGSLAFSGHRGISSMGKLLVAGMLLNLTCNLIFLPALLAVRKSRKLKAESRASETQL